ncbi:MAG: flagellar basal body L-ring protein FlgH [bacterium]|nr:flagellar basal body L-ring protein FlgH [bacterium]
MKKTIFIFLLALIFSVYTVNCITADSLWHQSQGAMYSTHKKEVRVGDIITIYISESSSAVQEASTRTQKQSQMSSNFLSNWDQIANILGNDTIRKRHELDIQGEDEYQGLGQTTRKSSVKAVISAIVTEILDSGNIYIVGEHKVKVNDEVETIRVSGIIRPGDIQSNNSVYSYQIAKAEVSVNGAGVVGSKQTPGILTKMFNWLF